MAMKLLWLTMRVCPGDTNRRGWCGEAAHHCYQSLDLPAWERMKSTQSIVLNVEMMV